MNLKQKKVLIISAIAVIVFAAAILLGIDILGGIVVKNIIEDEIQEKFNTSVKIEGNLKITDIDYNLFQDKAEITDAKIRIVDEDTLSRDYWSAEIISIKATGIKLLGWLFYKNIKLNDIHVEVNNLKYSIEFKKEAPEEPEKKVYKNWRKKIAGIFPNKVNSVKFKKLQININNIIRDIYPAADIAFADSIQRLAIHILDFDYEKGKSVKTGDISFYLRNYSRRFSQNFMALKIKSMKGLSKYNYLIFRDMSYAPYVSDEMLEERFHFRKKIYRGKINKFELKGFSFERLAERNQIYAETAQAGNLDFDIYLNKRKEVDPADTNIYPNYIFRKIHYDIYLKELLIHSGRITYRELHPIYENPAFIELTNFRAYSQGISTKSAANAMTRFDFSGNLMDEAKLHINMDMPLNSKEYKLHYTGSLYSMNLININNFLEKTIFVKVNSGFINDLNFNINIRNGAATGILEVDYDNLSVTRKQMDPETENYFTNLALTYLFNTVEIKKQNRQSDEDYKVGQIEYFLKPEDTFLQTLWFPLKQGIGKVVGYE